LPTLADRLMINNKLYFAVLSIAALSLTALAAFGTLQGSAKWAKSAREAPAPREQHVTLPIRTEESTNGASRPVIVGRLLEAEVPFLLDTGGQTSMLTEDWKDRVSIEGQTEAVDSNGKRLMYSTGPMRLVLGKITLDDVRFGMPGEYLQLTHGRRIWNTDGVTLGQDVLSRYHVVIDGPKRELSLLHSGDLPDAHGWVSFEGFWGTRHLTVVAMGRDDREMRVFLDTGYVLSRIAKEYAAPQPHPVDVRIGSNRIVGYAPQVLEGGDLTFSNPEKGDIVIHCTLGWDVLKKCRLEISYKHQKLRVTQHNRQQRNAADSR